jgi:uncharacterized SAM-dependent methyltransferase
MTTRVRASSSASWPCPYYLTRVEHDLLRQRADELAQRIGADHHPLELIELAAATARRP